MDESEVPLDEWLARADGRIGLVTTDVVRSTVLLHAEGTLNYADILRAHRVRAKRLAVEFGGRVIDETADGILAAFSSATDAYRFAHEFFVRPGHAQLKIRAGVHFGGVRASGHSLIGRNVHLAARVREHGLESELWVSDAAKTALEGESPDIASSTSWIASNEVELRGIPSVQRLWRAG